MVQETTDIVVIIKERLKAARDRQKSYADNRQKALEFEVGPFDFLERIGHVAYRLRLPQELSDIYDTFHVSNLKKCLADLQNLHRSEIPIVDVRWNSTRGLENFMKTKYPHLFVEQVIDGSTS
ncbi:hypothetical protein Tco_0378256 [Tanacetum coccineum]